ncbi:MULTISPECIES: hypothetical protein [unclassified Rhizobium]|uniref:hypothetical protein n=1 Tax=unclassified Rhizobium TaxID=2613769 RepID=UPI0007EA3063|nr:MULTISPECIES: hypothetical protein [unclassified Rhizobium]ANM11364.1 hypothetical protein AMK05_CH02997 [Rhizobium sp. N324]OYD04968.1 hypothetical protein AMK08_CH103015 [Rhizobium sp. N4311]
MADHDLYRLSRYSKANFKLEYPEKASADPTRPVFIAPNLSARPVFVGPDAAIEIDGGSVQGYINGAPSAPGGQLAQLIDRYRERIGAATSTDIDNGALKIVIVGTWHHIDFSSAPRFEGCLTHIVANDGSVTTKLYDERVFEWDETPHRIGHGFITSMFGELADFAEDLHDLADYQVCKSRGRYIGTSGLPAVGGVIWTANDDTPVLYSAATCTAEVEFEADYEEEEYLAGQPIIGDGTLGAAVASKLHDLDTVLGWFRGNDVDRSSHRPRKLKLREAPDAIEAIGYWIQVRSGDDEPRSEFRLFGGVPEWKHEVLEKTAEADTDEYLGNLYASDWIYDPTHQEPDREVRLLALGPLPTLSSEPL